MPLVFINCREQAVALKFPDQREDECNEDLTSTERKNFESVANGAWQKETELRFRNSFLVDLQCDARLQHIMARIVTLTAGARLGSYEIIGLLGAGGMGEVYRARDTRLDRIVAIKVLPEKFRNDPELQARFAREARAISSLQHPHICALFDVGQQGEITFLVMEYIEGESLADRLLRGPLPLDQVVLIGIDLADTLAKAHSQGLLHRDIKPSNIMLTKSGIKLMDFGLARQQGPIANVLRGSPPLTPSAPTVELLDLTSPASPITRKGTLIGTFHYLAPEVLQGAEADLRSDIFAAGCVLYEMAAGKRAFDGKSGLSVLNAILEKDPDPVSVVQPRASQQLDAAISTCLRKNPEQRWQSAAELRSVLQLIARTSSQAQADPASKRVRAWKVLAAVACLLLLDTAVVAGLLFKRAPAALPLSAELDLPPSTILDTVNDPISISPDGHRLVVAVLGADNKPELWTRQFNTGRMERVPSAQGAEYPFWSPDSLSVGFFSGGKLKRVDLATGIGQDICDAPHGRGGSWNSAGIIVFAPDAYGGLSIVSASGGTPTDLEIAQQPLDSLRLPRFLPDNDHFLYLRFPQNGPSEVKAFSLSTRQVKDLVSADASAQYSGHELVFVRNGNLFVQKFDPAAVRLTGAPLQLAAGIQVDPARSTAAFSVSESRIVYAPGAGVSLKQLQWIDATGKSAGNIAEPAGYYYAMSLSLDQKTIALALSRGAVSLLDVATGTPRPFTAPGGFPPDQQFVWSPDSKWLAFTAMETQSSPLTIQLKSSDGRAESRVFHVCRSAACFPTAWSPDGKMLAIVEHSLERSSKPSDGATLIFSVDTGKQIFSILHAVDLRFSPDGKWLAYISDENGADHLYVSAFPPAGARWQVASEAASELSWKSAPMLFYSTSSGKIWAVEITPRGNEIEIGRTVNMFGGRTFPTDISWDITSDGKRALAAVPTETTAPHSLKLLQDWAAAIKQ